MNGTSASRVATGYARAVGVLACVVSPAVLSGWLFGVAAPTRLVAGWPQMAPLTALVIALCGISLLLGARVPVSLFGVAQVQSVLSRRLAHFSAGLALLLCLLRLAAYLLGWNLGLDSIGLAHTAAAHGMQPGAMSPASTAFCVSSSSDPIAITGHIRQPACAPAWSPPTSRRKTPP